MRPSISLHLPGKLGRAAGWSQRMNRPQGRGAEKGVQIPPAVSIAPCGPATLWAVCRKRHVWESPEGLGTKIMKRDPTLPRPPAVTFPEDG